MIVRYSQRSYRQLEKQTATACLMVMLWLCVPLREGIGDARGSTIGGPDKKILQHRHLSVNQSPQRAALPRTCGHYSLLTLRLPLRGGSAESTNKEGKGCGDADAYGEDYVPPGRLGSDSKDDGWDIEDMEHPLEFDSGADDPERGSPIADGFLTPSLLHDLEAPIRRKALRNPKGHYVYNRTADRWEQRRWDPVARPGEDQFHRMFGYREHPMHRTARRINETLEQFVARAPCWPPYCRKCPLRHKPSLTASALALHERITGEKINISTALRCGAQVPFSPDLAQGLGGYCVPRSLSSNLDALLQAAVEDNDIPAAAMLLRAGANVSVVDGYGMTPLHEAAYAGFADMCKLLLDSGATWNRLDQYRRSPLHWAAFFGRISALVAIVSHVAHACPQEQVRDEVHRQDYVGDTPEQLAGWMGRIEVLRYFKVLLERGSASAALYAEGAMEEEARLAARPRSEQTSELEAAVAEHFIDKDTLIKAEGPEAPPDDEPREFNEYVVGLPHAPVVNRVPWGPGTAHPTPWQCWFCKRQFATYQLAHDHEVPCARLHGWEMNEAAVKDSLHTCPGNKEVLKAYHGVIPFNMSSILDGTRPVGVPTASALAQLPDYLHDPATYERWKNGEDVVPPEMLRPIGIGGSSKAQLDAKDRAILLSRGAAAGEADAPVTQASSILRKKGVAAMNKEGIMRRLEELHIRFQETAGVATLRATLIDAEIELGLILAPKGWTRKRDICFLDAPQLPLTIQGAPPQSGGLQLAVRDADMEGGSESGHVASGAATPSVSHDSYQDSGRDSDKSEDAGGEISGPDDD